MNNKPIHLKGLNGIRAIAAIAVVVSHITMQLDLFGLDAHIFGSNSNGGPKTLDLAGYGVSMFFVLSGFLITFLLWKEKEKQPIAINKFYFRRILRIWPLYYLYFIICLLIYWIFDLETNFNSTGYYIFYAANIPFILGKELLFLGHFWSLAVEEQFYLFWPWLNKLNKKRIFNTSLILIVLLIGTKSFLHIFYPSSIFELIIHVTRFHCMIIGGLAAILYSNSNKLFLYLTKHPISQLIAWGCLILVSLNKFHIASFLDNEILSIVTVFIIIGQITQKGLISLENNVLNFLGKNSYGIYVIHPLIIFLISRVYVKTSSIEWINYLVVFSSVILSTVFLSHLSFKYFETPFLKLKKRKFTVIESSAFLN